MTTPNPRSKGLFDAHSVVCDLCIDFKMPWWAFLIPYTKTWSAWEKLNRVAKYLYAEFKKEPWFEI